jgi:hypothetical protein
MPNENYEPIDADEFRHRLLAALEKPKSSRWVKIVNSPLFITVLVATTLSAIGSYFVQSQQCHREVAALLEKDEPLRKEQLLRELNILYAVRASDDLTDLMKRFVALQPINDQLKDMKLSDIRDVRVRMAHRHTALEPYPEELREGSRSWPLLAVVNGDAPIELSNVPMTDIKAYVNKFLFQSPFSFELYSNCGRGTIWNMMIGNDPKILRRSYERGNFAESVPQ